MPRKEKYDKNTFPLLAQGYARRGLIDTQIAKNLGISCAVYYEYQNKYPEFMEAIKEGKRPVDVEVENALLKRALGFSYEETHIEYKPGKKADDKPVVTHIKKIRKFIVPDTTACIFWKKNREPKYWRDKHDIDFGDVLIKVITAIPRSKDPKKKEEKKK
jgi:hypothetical protein